MDDEFSLVTLKCGIRSLRSHRYHQTFHPVVGPMAEARGLHAGQQEAAERGSRDRSFVTYDIGLGAAANSIAMMEALLACGQDGEIHSFDQDTAALRFALEHAEALEYVLPHRAALEKLLADSQVTIFGGETSVRWQLHLGDFTELIAGIAIPPPAGILFDPFSPGANPEMWSVETFRKILARTDPELGCLLTNYTRSTAVRTTLLMAGFYVGRGVATGEKDETTIASNQLALLKRPLGKDWLAGAERSTSSAPLRGEPLRGVGLGVEATRISASDYEELAGHPQFRAAVIE